MNIKNGYVHPYAHCKLPDKYVYIKIYTIDVYQYEYFLNL